MTTSGYIPRFKQEMELGANYLLERGILITYVGWNREDRRYLQKLNLEQIGQISPETAEMILNEAQDDMVVSSLQQAFDGVTTKRAKKAIKTLRKTGFAELPVIRRQVDAPNIKTLAPDGDFFFLAMLQIHSGHPIVFGVLTIQPKS